MSNLSNKIAEDLTVFRIMTEAYNGRWACAQPSPITDMETIRYIINQYEENKEKNPQYTPLNLSPADILIRDEMINKTKLQQDYVAMQRHAFPDEAIKQFGAAEIMAQRDIFYRQQEIRERTKRFFLYLFAMIFVTICLINW